MTLPLLLYEDDEVLLVRKPAGWNTHAPDPHAGAGLYDWLRAREPRWAQLAIVHRLDKETSGLLLFPKHRAAARHLMEQFAARTVTKRYLFWTDRAVAAGARTWRSRIAKHGSHFVSHPPDQAVGDPAETTFQPGPEAAGRTLVTALPATGRTHQIRLHAADLGWPILGDVRYGGSPFPRLCLHAAHLAFTHPTTGARLAFDDPADFLADPRLALRAAFLDPAETTACRLAHGAADGLPGLCLDRLGPCLFARTEDEPLTAAHEQLAHAWRQQLGLAALYHTGGARQAAETAPRLLAGVAAPAEFAVREHGLTYLLGLELGPDLGLPLDLRDHRYRLLTNHLAPGTPLWADGPAGRELLHVFARTGTCAVPAARAGARVTNLDPSRAELDWGRRSLLANGLDPAHHDAIYGDPFDWLRRLARKGRAWDAILLTPPNATQAKTCGHFRADRDYPHLLELALPLLRPGGLLLACTRTPTLAPAAFVALLHESLAAAGRPPAACHYYPQPPDQPITRTAPALLKSVWLRLP